MLVKSSYIYKYIYIYIYNNYHSLFDYHSLLFYKFHTIFSPCWGPRTFRWKPEKAGPQHSTSNTLCLLEKNFDV